MIKIVNFVLCVFCHNLREKKKIDNIIHILERIWNNKNSHLLQVRIQNDTATVEDSSTVSYKTEHTLPIQPSNHTP